MTPDRRRSRGGRNGLRNSPIAATLGWLRFALIAAFLVPPLLFTAAVWFDYDRTRELSTAEAFNVANLLREHALKVIDMTELTVNVLDRRTRAMTWDDIRARHDALQSEIRDITASYPQIAGVGLIDAEGRQWLSVIPGLPRDLYAGRDVSNREFWRGQKDQDQGTLVTEAFQGPLTGQLLFAISRRRGTPDGSFNGTIHVAIPVSYFTAFWSGALDRQDGARIALIRADGKILAHIPSLAGATHSVTAANSPLLHHVAGGINNVVYTDVSPIDGVECIYAATKVGDYPLYVSYGVPISIVLHKWWLRVLVLGPLCVFSSLAIAGATILARRHAIRTAQEQLRRENAERIALEAQRLEALALLAAGVAHDFGNVIQAIEFGAAVIERCSTEARVVQSAKRIITAARQGATLTRRMLDFSRDDAAEAEQAFFSPANIVEGACNLLATTLGRSHRLQYRIERAGLPRTVRGDASGLERAVMNLVINARDAMPSGGEIVLTVEPEQVGVDPAPRTVDLEPGLYARISVADKGGGMAPEVLARASEPFFTTKPRGRGTGLGLAGARGYAQRLGGNFHIESALGVGTRVTLWLPGCDGDVPAGNEQAAAGASV